MKIEITVILDVAEDKGNTPGRVAAVVQRLLENPEPRPAPEDWSVYSMKVRELREIRK